MYRKVKINLVFLILIFFVPPKIFAATEWKFSPYIGLDAQIRKMKFKKRFGDDLFKKEAIQGNFYLGFKVNKYLGFEIGHQVTNKKNRNASPSAMARLFQEGVRVPFITLNTKQRGTTQIKGWNLNVIGFLPISSEYQTSLIGIAGLSRLESKLKYTLTSTLAGGAVVYRQIKFKQRKSVLRLGGGVQKMFSDSFGVRTTLVWENTSKFNNITQNFLRGIYAVKLKDSWTYGIGAFIIF